MSIDVYQTVTDRIIAKLEQGTAPWVRPWSGGGAPANLITGKAYRGINSIMLGMGSEYSSPYWVTFKQSAACGGNVKGQKASPVVFWKFLDAKLKPGETKARKIPFVKFSHVFNVEQSSGIAHKRLEATEAEPREFTPIESAERIAAGYPNGPSVADDGNGRAFYRPAEDGVHMPARESFDGAPSYYATLFHELTHSTGHESRLAREGVTNPQFFGSHDYSREELVAEMGSAFLIAETGLDSDSLISNSASYIASWIRELKADPKLVITAAGQAQRAVDRIIGREWNGKEMVTIAR